jgi:hypothetical protein
MPNEIAGPGGTFHFGMVDIRDLDGEQLLASENIGDNVIAILTRLGSEPNAVRRILTRIEKGPSEEREEAVAELTILAGLRRLGGKVNREAGKMPIQEDIRDHDYYGPPLRQENARGRMELLLDMIAIKFGAVPPPVRQRLALMEPYQLKAASRLLIDAHAIEDLFSR